MKREKGKSKKGLAAVLLCVVMVIAGAMTAFAQEETDQVLSSGLAGTTVYVDAGAAAEAADGSKEAPFASIQDAIDAIVAQGTDGEAYVVSVAAGTYARFLVPHGVSNITIEGQGDTTVITTMDGSALSVETKEQHGSDGQGIIIWGANITLKNMKITSGSSTNGLWWASAVGTHDIMWGPSSEVDTPVILDNCTFEGSQAGYAFMAQRSKYTVNNCRISGYSQAIYFAGDNFSTQDCRITNNTISNCVFAIHGYYGSGTGNPLVIQGNTISGTQDRFAVIAVMDQSNSGAMRLDISGNTFSYTIVGGINQRKEGDVVQGSMGAVMAANTMNDHSFVADAYWLAGDDYGTTFYAPKQPGKIATWYADPTSEAGSNIEAIKSALEEYGTAGQVIDINSPAQETFTVAKNAIVIQDYVDAGDLKIQKTVRSNETDREKFNFTVKFTREDGSVLNGTYDYVDAAGEVQTVTLKDGSFTFALGDGESITVKDMFPGTRYEVTEEAKEGYKSEAVGGTGAIVAKDTQVASFTNTSDSYVEPTPDPTPDQKPDQPKGQTGTSGNLKQAGKVKTGDANHMEGLLLVLAASACVSVFMIGRKKKAVR